MANRLLPLLLIVGMLLVLIVGMLLVQGRGDDGGGKTAGKHPAPDFTLKMFDGSTFSLSGHKGAPVVLNFYASWCTTCGIEVFDLEKVYQEYLIKKVMFVGVAIDDVEEKARAYVKKYEITYPTGFDADGTIKKAYALHGVPFTFFIDKEGFITYIHGGAVTEALLKYELDKML